MCTISNTLKLCTCESDNKTDYEHSWALKRHNGISNCIVGETLMPYNEGMSKDSDNKRRLSRMLNARNCFDKDMHIQPHDILILRFSIKPTKKHPLDFLYGDYLVYAFEYINGKWKSTDYDPFEENLDFLRGGKIENPFAKST